MIFQKSRLEADGRVSWANGVSSLSSALTGYSVSRSCSLHLLIGVWNSMLTFVRNRGELAEGWYDPTTSRKATESFTRPLSSMRHHGERRLSPNYIHRKQQTLDGSGSGSSDDGNIGPALPENQGTNLSKAYRSGPTIPSLQDLELRQGEF